MKRVLLFALTIVMGASVAFAQDATDYNDNRIWKNKSKYLNVGFVQQDVSALVDGLEYDLMKSDWGVSLSSGRTIYLHKQPIAKMIKFGLDCTWFDLNVASHSYYDYFVAGDYGDYDGFNAYYDESDAESIYQAELGMQFGPSVTINPVHHLKLSAYFRVTPSFSMFYLPDEETCYGNYMTVLNVGGTIAWKLLSLGVEHRSGKAVFKELGGDATLLDAGEDAKIKTDGWRFYFGFRF